MASESGESESQKSPRTLVLCFDGTAEQFDTDNTNVVKFFSLLKKDEEDRQLCYYQAGIGTYFQPGVISPLFQWAAKILDEAVAWYLDEHIIDGYRFLMQNYRAGDTICLFGFSRGAYVARCLAGMLHKVGLLPRDNHEQVVFAYKLYVRRDAPGVQLASRFRVTYSRAVRVAFIGVWDTVASVGVLRGRTLPFTATNQDVRTFRHALALDEHRTRFRPNHYHRPSPAMPPPHAPSANFNKHTPSANPDGPMPPPSEFSTRGRFPWRGAGPVAGTAPGSVSPSPTGADLKKPGRAGLHGGVSPGPPAPASAQRSLRFSWIRRARSLAQGAAELAAGPDGAGAGTERGRARGLGAVGAGNGHPAEATYTLEVPTGRGADSSLADCFAHNSEATVTDEREGSPSGSSAPSGVGGRVESLDDDRHKGVSHDSMRDEGKFEWFLHEPRRGRGRRHAVYTKDEWAPDAPDVREVWFAGCHSDVGGGAVADDASPDLAQIPLRWMVREVIAAQCGVLFDAHALATHFVPAGLPVPRSPTRARERALDGVDARGTVHDQLAARAGAAGAMAWWLLELVPMVKRWQDSDGRWRMTWGINLGRGRSICDERPLFHATVRERMEDRALRYDPRAQWARGSEVYVE